MQASEWRLIGDDFGRNELGPDPFVVFSFFAFARAGNPPHGNFLGLRRIGSVDDHVAVNELPKVGRLVNESFVRRGIEISVFSAVVIISVRALAGGAGAELGEFYNSRWIGDVVKADAAKAFVIFAFVVKVRVIVLAHGRFGSRVGDRRLRSGHEN